jgi:hypothetical protein
MRGNEGKFALQTDPERQDNRWLKRGAKGMMRLDTVVVASAGARLSDELKKEPPTPCSASTF